MNPQDCVNAMSPFNFQRCVDGELSEAEETAFLRDLDKDSSQWRQLALMFIEERLLIRTLQHGHIPVAPSQPQPQSPPVQPQQEDNWRALAGYLALSLVMGIALGGAWVQWRQGHLGFSGPLAESYAPVESHSIDPQNPLAVDRNLLHQANHRASDQPATNHEIPLLTDSESLAIPRYPSNQLQQRSLKPPRMIPVEVERELLRRGLTVDQQRRFMYVEMEDGQRALVPQDTVKVRYAVQ